MASVDYTTFAPSCARSSTIPTDDGQGASKAPAIRVCSALGVVFDPARAGKPKPAGRNVFPTRIPTGPRASRPLFVRAGRPRSWFARSQTARLMGPNTGPALNSCLARTACLQFRFGALAYPDNHRKLNRNTATRAGKSRSYGGNGAGMSSLICNHIPGMIPRAAAKGVTSTPRDLTTNN